MPTVKELRAQAKSYGLKGYSTLKKYDLHLLIIKARSKIGRERIRRAFETGRYPAARKDFNNPHKEAQRKSEYRQIDDEVTATLRANKYEQTIKRDRTKRLKPLKPITGHIKPWKRETFSKSIIREGETLLNQIRPIESTEKGRRVITWKLFRDLDESTVDRFMSKIEELQTAFYLRFSFTYRIKNIEANKPILWHTNLGGSPTLLTNFVTPREWLREKDVKRLNLDRIDVPNTKWDFMDWVQVEVKCILTNQPLLGAGRLPDWLRNKMALYALDEYDDNLCLFRCIAVHKGARPDRCTKEAKQLALDYYKLGTTEPRSWSKIPLDQLKTFETHFKLGIRVYEPTEDGIWRLLRQPAHYEEIGTKPMTIGFYNDHAFLIKNIAKLANQYACAHCDQQFTQACSLQRHADRCTKGETKICCPGEVIERPQSAYEKAFYPKSNASKGSIDWLEYEAEKRGIHIHHALCGHGGERWIAEAPVDGYEPTTKTVFQYHGCHFHGCPTHCKQDNAWELLKKTRQQERKIKAAGYTLVVVWECKAPGYKALGLTPKTIVYPHAIVYDFESYLDKTKAYNPTTD